MLALPCKHAVLNRCNERFGACKQNFAARLEGFLLSLACYETGTDRLFRYSDVSRELSRVRQENADLQVFKIFVTCVSFCDRHPDTGLASDVSDGRWALDPAQTHVHQMSQKFCVAKLIESRENETSCNYK